MNEVSTAQSDERQVEARRPAKTRVFNTCSRQIAAMTVGLVSTTLDDMALLEATAYKTCFSSLVGTNRSRSSLEATATSGILLELLKPIIHALALRPAAFASLNACSKCHASTADSMLARNSSKSLRQHVL